MPGASHSSVTRYRELARHSHTDGHQRELLLDGLHLLSEARASGLQIESAAFEHAALAAPDVRDLAEQIAASGADVFIVSAKVLGTMSPAKTPSGVVGIARRSIASLESALSAPLPLVVVAHDVQDPGNVGGIMRTAEAAGATALIVSGDTADPFGWKALRGSMGSALRLPIARAEIGDTMQALSAARISTVALVPREGKTLFSTNLRTSTALVVGSEGSGLPDHVLRRMDHLVSIPMRDPVESLNVGVAAALVLYEAFRQRAGTAPRQDGGTTL